MKKLSIAILAFSFWTIVVSSAPGATVVVLVGSGGLRFNPTNVFINVADTVQWQWQGSFHSTTSGTNGTHADDNGVPNGLWDSGVASPSFSYTNQFNAAGIFSYYCSVHHGAGMTGEVVVAGTSLPPLISITNPLPGAVLATPANVTLHAAVTNVGGFVTNVQFLAGTALLTNETALPFSLTVNGLTAGSYAFAAIATDNNGQSATNSVNINVVTPVPTALGNIFILSGTNFQFNYSVSTGLDYVVQRSTDLSQWVPLVTNVAASNPAVFIDPNATNLLNFYRVGLLPNP